MSEFAKIFKELRENSHLSQEELGKALNISRSAIGMYEQGRRVPDLDTLERIADYFNISISVLTGNAPDTEPYYTDPKVRELTSFLKENKEYSVLFDSCRNVRPEDIEKVKDLLDIWNRR